MSDWADQLGQPAGTPESSGDDWANSLTATKSNEARTLDANLMVPTTPDRSAKVLDLHKRTGLPINLVDSQLETVEQEAKKTDFDTEKFTKENPVVSKWMTENPQQASLGYSDHQNLSTLEKFLRVALTPVRSFFEDRPGEDTASEVVKKSTKQAGYMYLQSHGGIEQQVATIKEGRTFPITPEHAVEHAKKMGLIGKDVAVDVSQGLLDQPEILDAVMKAADDLERMDVERIQKTELYQKGAERFEFGQASIEELQPRVRPGSAKYYLGASTQAFFGSVLPMMGVSLATGGTAMPGLATMGTQVYGQRFGESLKEGRTIDQAKADAWFYSLAETIPEQIPLGIALKRGTPYFKKLFQAAWTEGTQEMFTEVLQAGYDAGVLDENVSLGDALRRVVDAGIVGALMGGSMATVAHAAQKPGDMIQKNRLKRQAKDQENFFTALGENATESKIREQLPDKYRELVDTLTKDGPVENVYTPIEFFQSRFEQAGVNPRQMAIDLGIVKQYDEAVEHGGKLAIPTSVYATKIAPTEFNADFAKELTITPDGLTSREMGDLQTEFEQAKAKEPDIFEQSVQKVREDVQKQLEAIMPSDVAEPQAALWEARYRARAERLGVDPWTLYQQQTKTFTREGDVPRGTSQDQQLTSNEVVLNQQGMAPAQRMAGDLTKGPALTLTPNTVPGEGPYRVTHWLDGQPVRHEAFPDTTAAQKAFDQALTETNTTAEKMGEKSIAEQRTLFQQAKDQTETPEFKRWFGDSKVVDENGKPLVVYHGSRGNSDIRNFDIGKSEMDADERGIYFTDNPQSAEQYVTGFGEESAADTGGALYPAYLKIRNPYVIDALAWHMGEGLTPAQARRKGHDGFVIENHEGGTTYVAFRPEQIKSAIGNRGTFDPNQANILYQSAQQPIFYSGLLKAIENAKQQSASASDWKAIVKKLPGVKQDEIDAVGLNDWLDLMQDSPDKKYSHPTKDIVLGYVRDNGVQVKDVEKGKVTPPLEEYEREMGLLQKKIDAARTRAFGGSLGTIPPQVVSQVGQWAFDMALDNQQAGQSRGRLKALGLSDEHVEAIKEYGVLAAESKYLNEKILAARKGTDTKFASYQLPGGENYRELLLTLPPTINEVPAWKVIRPDGHVDMTFTTERSARNQARISGPGYTVQQGETIAARGGFRSPHFDETNILAHVRFNERTDAEGKRVLFIEEVQSDWAQKGRKEGFAGPKITEAEEDALRAEFRAMHPDERVDSMRGQEIAAILKRHTAPVPSAPFVTKTESWAMLAIKRMIRYAAENGFDRIAWTTGEQQAERYDLSHQIKELNYLIKSDDGPVDLSARTHDGKLKDIASNVSLNKLDDYVGKDVAEKIRKFEGQPKGSGAWRTLSGLDLKVGGEGMKAFYDQMLPQMVNKYIKKWGGKVGETKWISGKDISDVAVRNAQQQQENVFTNIAMDDLPDKYTSAPSFDITPAMRDAVMQGQALFQKERGVTRFTDRTVNIELFNNADLSTMLHESSHVFLLEMYDDVQYLRGLKELNAKQQGVIDDFNNLLKWFGITEQELLEQTTVDGKTTLSPKSVKANEQFARGMEAYLAEGKAPSSELRSAFQRFKAWLTHVYRLWKNDPKVALNVHLNDEVRGIMDRLLATDEQIRQAQAESEIKAVFTDAVEAGMTDIEFAAYQKTLEDANEESKQNLEQQLMREFQRERTKWWKEERAKIRAEIEADVDQRPIYRALAELKREGGPRLDRKAVTERFKDRVKQLPTGVAVKEGGIDPDTAAEMMGFKSGEDLINQLSTMQTRNKVIEAETDQRMVQEHGNMLLDGSIFEKAREAVRDEKRSEIILRELKALQKKAREVKPFVEAAKKEGEEQKKAGKQIYLAAIPTVAQARETAQRTIAGTRIRDIRPMQYFAAARKASKSAIEAVNKGDFVLAAVLKRQEMIANEMYRAAVKAQAEVKKILDYLKKFDKKSTRERIGKVEGGFLDQIDALIARYNLHPQTEAVLAKKKAALREWYDAQVALGFEPTIDPDLMDESRRTNYKDVPLEDLQALQDAVKSIEYIASRIGKMKTIMGEKEYNDVVDLLVGKVEETLTKLPKAKEQILKSWLDRKKDMLKGHDVDLVSMETLIEILDGAAVGPWHDIVFNPASEAQSAEYDMAAEYGDVVGKIIDEYVGEDTSRILDMFQTDLQEEPMSRYKLLSIAFNLGNESNMEKMAKGHEWTEVQILEAVKKLDAKDLAFVQKIWDTLDTFYPKLNELQKKVSGVELARVQPRAVHLALNDGSKVDLKGGYYPASYDPDFSVQGQKQDTGPLAGLTEQGYARATAPDSFRKTRTKFAAPMRLDFGYVLQKHLAGVMKDLSHREFLIDMNRLLRDKRIRKVIQERLGREYEQMFVPWLRGIANDRNVSPADMTGWDKRFEMARSHVTVVALGFKVTSILAQIAGLPNALEYVSDQYGSRYMATALNDFIRSPFDSLDMVRKKSGEMRHRFETIDREVRDELRRMQSAHPIRGLSKLMLAKEMFERAAFYGINFMDRVVAVPTWMAAYQGAKDQMIKDSPGMDSALMEKRAIHAGDAAVRRTQGAGGAKDLSAIQRKRGVMKILTMFYTPFAAWYGRLRTIGGRMARSNNRWRYTPEAIMHVALITMIPTIMAELLAGRGPEDCKNKEGGDYAACFGRWAAIKAGFSLAAPIPVVRDIANGLEHYAMDGRPRDTRFSPVLDAINRVSTTTRRAGSVMFGDKPLEDDLVFDIFETSGYFMGFPTAQPRVTLEYLYDLMTDEAKAETPLEFLSGLAYRRKPDRTR